MKKIDHIHHLLFNELKDQWTLKYGQSPAQTDVSKLHEEFTAELNEIITQFSTPTIHTDLALAFLRKHSIVAALTSGYSRQIFDRAAQEVNKLYPFSASTTADEVEEGTPIAMLNKNKCKLSIPDGEEHSIFFTDASSDVQNVRSANQGFWIIGVSAYSTHVGITSKEDLAGKTANHLERQRFDAKRLLLQSGAHAVIHDMSEVPLAIVAASQASCRGQKPNQSHSLDIKYPFTETYSSNNSMGITL